MCAYFLLSNKIVPAPGAFSGLSSCVLEDSPSLLQAVRELTSEPSEQRVVSCYHQQGQWIKYNYNLILLTCCRHGNSIHHVHETFHSKILQHICLIFSVPLRTQTLLGCITMQCKIISSVDLPRPLGSPFLKAPTNISPVFVSNTPSPLGRPAWNCPTKLLPSGHLYSPLYSPLYSVLCTHLYSPLPPGRSSVQSPR